MSMRIVGTIDHPTMKITIFRMDNRLSVKFESGLYEQTYKFRSGEGIDTPEDVQAWADPELIAGVETILRHMHQQRTAARNRQTEAGAMPEFEDII